MAKYKKIIDVEQIVEYAILCVIFAIVWLFFAVFDFTDSNEVTIYSLRDTVDTDNGRLPEMISNTPVTYRIENNYVISKIGEFIDKYDDCVIYDVENWRCKYSDTHATFGVKDGDFFESCNVDDNTELENTCNKDKQVSRFFYIANNIKWYLIDDHAWIVIPFLPFFK